MDYLFPLFLASFSLYGLTLAMVLFTKNVYLKRATRILGALIVILSVLIFNNAITRIDEIKLGFGTGIVIGTVWYLIAPLLYFNAIYILYPNRSYKWKDLLHFSPFLLSVFNVIPFFILLDSAQRSEWSASGASRSDWLFFTMTSGYVLYLQYLVYLPLSFLKINKYIKNNKKDLSNQGLNRIVFVRNGYFMLILFIFLMELFARFGNSGNGSTILFLGLAGTIYSLAFISIRNPSALFNKIPFKWSFRSRTLPEYEMAVYSQALEDQMNERIYRDPELTLNKLAQQLNLQPRQLSDLIRKKHHCNYSDFLNTYRVEAAKKLLTNDKYKHWSILAIGLEVGFNSKSTFNRVFKKLAGVSPSEYMNTSKNRIRD
ncbi:MAG: helix-turn-helix transcriptional regulator [Bacteroidota bacterium]